MNPYDKLMTRKRKWTPVQTTAGMCKDGAQEAIHRALAQTATSICVPTWFTMLSANSEASDEFKFIFQFPAINNFRASVLILIK